MYKGLYTALITPFEKGEINFDAFARLIEFQIASGVNGVVVCGTTGESAVMTPREYEQTIETCVKTVAGRVPVIAGTGTNDTQKTIANTRVAEKAGADAVLVVTPYYNKPSQEGLFLHFKAVHDATKLPVVLYNVPGRTGVNITPETVARLADLPRVAGIKDATPDLMRPLRLRAAVSKKDFAVLSGEDASIVAFLAHGGDGCISVTSNVAPALCAGLHRAWAAKDWAEVERLRDLLLPLHDAMFVESNPCPVKFAAAQMGFGDGSVRLPLCEISEKSKETVLAAMRQTGVAE